MVDPLSAAVTLGALAAGWLLGRHARLKAARPSKPVLPICLCRHHYGTHEVAEAPLAVGWSFTFERGIGIRWRDDGKGCPVWYLSAADYERAHTEADNAC